jgi:hypothetical protein
MLLKLTPCQPVYEAGHSSSSEGAPFTKACGAARPRARLWRAISEDGVMRVTRLAAVAIALAAALTCVACLTAAGTAAARAASSAPSSSTPACYDYAVAALRQHVVVRRMPPACAGLAPQEVNEAVARAIRTVVGPLHKAAARALAVADSRYLGSLVRPVGLARPALAVAPPGTTASTVPARLAALAAWLIAAIAGARLLASRLSANQRRDRVPGVPLWVMGSHASVATAGLALWVAFVLTGSPLIGWLDVALTWLIAGLGMATLLADPGGHNVTSAGAGVAAGPSTATAVLTMARPRVPVLTIALHGALAATTMALVLIAVLSVG